MFQVGDIVKVPITSKTDNYVLINLNYKNYYGFFYASDFSEDYYSNFAIGDVLSGRIVEITSSRVRITPLTKDDLIDSNNYNDAGGIHLTNRELLLVLLNRMDTIEKKLNDIEKRLGGI